jgi:tetratricopeptide (TPR) repeat protein
VVILSNSNNSVTDIGWHVLDSTRKVEPYKYRWALLDTLRITFKTKGVDAVTELYQQLKASKNASFIFNENQLNYLGNELRKDKKIKEAIKIYELNAKEYPKSTLAYESLGETYKLNKNKKMAVKYFEKAFQSDPQNQHWTYMLENLKMIERKKKNR